MNSECMYNILPVSYCLPFQKMISYILNRISILTKTSILFLANNQHYFYNAFVVRFQIY